MLWVAMSSLMVELESGLGSSGVLTRSRVTVSPKKPLDAIISDLSDAAALRRRTTSPCREVVAAAEMRSPPFLGRSVKRTLGREEGNIATGGERQCPPSSRWNSQARILKYMTELFPGRTSVNPSPNSPVSVQPLLLFIFLQFLL